MEHEISTNYHLFARLAYNSIQWSTELVTLSGKVQTSLTLILGRDILIRFYHFV